MNFLRCQHNYFKSQTEFINQNSEMIMKKIESQIFDSQY